MSDFKRYKTISDKAEEARLITLAQAGDDDALNLVVESQLNWAWLCAKRWSETFPSLDFDDIWSDAMLAIIHCTRAFKPSLGYRLSTYLGNAIKSRVFQQFKYRSRHKRRGVTVSLTEPIIADLEDCRNGSPQRHAERRELVEAVNYEIDRLPARTADIVRRRMDGETLKSIGTSHSISRERTRQIEDEAHCYLHTSLRRVA